MNTTNSYLEGIDQDTSPLKTKKSTYYLLKDGHIVTAEGGLSTGAVENEKGTALSFIIPNTQAIYRLEFVLDTQGLLVSTGNVTIPTASQFNTLSFPTGSSVATMFSSMSLWYSNDILNKNFALYQTSQYIYIVGLNAPLTVHSSTSSTTAVLITPAQTGLYIIGSASTRDELVVITTNNSSTTPGQNGLLTSYGQIWKFHYNEISKQVVGALPTNYLVPSEHLFYNNLLNLSGYNRIKKIISRYENDHFSKIYFTDGYNNFRHFNFNQPNHIILDPSKLELIANIDMAVPKLYNISFGGRLTTGRYQYAYQLYDRYGAESLVSPLSDMIDVASRDDSATSSQLYFGNTPNFACNKTIQVLIDGIDQSFDVIRIIALQYTDIASDPLIRVIEERNIDSPLMYFTDSGDPGIDTMTVTELRTLQSKLFVCQSIETKNNKLCE